jgi:hypothetical protein
MKYKINNLVLVLFVLSTIVILGSTIDAFAADEDGRGDDGVGDIEACLNRPNLPNLAPCDMEDEWSGGNITFEASFREGASIPVRVDITGLEESEDVDFHTLVFDWDITKTQGNIIKHTFDYITSFDRNDRPHPCLEALPKEVCENWSSANFTIPAPSFNTVNGTVNGTNQPIDSFNSLPIEERQFWMFSPNGTTIDIFDVDYVFEGDPSFSGSNTETTQLFVNYTTTSTDVIAAFGAHIASPDDWDFHAVDVNGKSFQVGCEEIHSKGGCDGGQINLDASNIIAPMAAPELTLLKNVTNNSGGTADNGDWKLNADGSDNPNFNINVLGNNTDAFIVEIGTEYTLSEFDGPLGYTAINGDNVFSCVTTDSNGVEGSSELTSIITLFENESAVCTITNDDDGVSLTLVKEVINDNGGTAIATDFTLNATNSTGITVISGNGNVTSGDNFKAGTYDLIESSLAGYTASDWVCVGD